MEAASKATPADILLSNTQQPQAYIKTVSDEDAPKCPEVRRLYDKWRNSDDGTLDNVLTIHSCNPAALEAHFQLYEWSVVPCSEHNPKLGAISNFHFDDELSR